MKDSRMNANNSLDYKLQEAQNAVQASEGYHVSKAEQRLNKITDKVHGLEENSSATGAGDVALITYAAVKDQVGHFAENSKVLIAVLDEVGKAHPFIQVAVSLFKVALTLELTRRENDQKVLALNAAMCDMMSVMTLLKKVADPKEKNDAGESIETRLRQRMEREGGIIDSIKRCAKLCDSYQKRHLTVKIFTSLKWQSKFTEVATQFEEHKTGIQFDLQIHASVTLATNSDTLGRIEENVAGVMKMVFELMRSPEERELASFVSGKGGPEKVSESDQLLADVLAKQKGREDGPIKRGQGQTGLSVHELRKEIGKDVEQMLTENTKTFEQKFEAQRIQLEEVKVVIKHESDRVIDAVLAGPHERIVDRDLYHIWKEMGWKGSVKARHLVMALHDHFIEHSHDTAAAQENALSQIRDIANETNSEPAVQKVAEIANVVNQSLPATAPEDMWALQYINILRVQPLLEALDDDVSTFVTVTEVNAFTAARPAGWSLPHWIAYWTIGSELAANWYYRRIICLIAEMYHDVRKILPANRKVVNGFVNSFSLRFIDDLLAGLREPSSHDGIDWDNSSLFAYFKGYIVEQEDKIEKVLRTVTYHLDDENTLTLVTGGGRPEKYILPLMCLLLRRAVYIIKLAQTTILHDLELEIIEGSIDTAHSAVLSRIATLKAICKLQNLDANEQLGKYFYGIYYYVIKEVVIGDYWTQGVDWSYDFPDLAMIEVESDAGPDTSELASDAGPGTSKLVSDAVSNTPELASGAISDAPELASDAGSDTSDLASDGGPDRTLVPLFYGEQTDPEFGRASVSTVIDISGSKDGAVHSLADHWSGSYTYGRGRDADGLVSFDITAHGEDGSIEGRGIDAFGEFFIVGTVSERQITFKTEYHDLVNGAWKHEGEVDEEMEAIHGTWGDPDESDDEDLERDDDNDQADTETNSDAPDNTSNSPENHSPNDDADTEDNGSDPPDNDSNVRDDDSNTPDEVAVDADDNSDDGDEETASETNDTEVFNGGTFFLKRRPVDYFLFRPTDEELERNRPLALWKWALHSVVRTNQARTLQWKVILARRNRRRRYIELLLQLEAEDRLGEDNAAEWKELLRTTHPEDLHFWRTLAFFTQQREINHGSVSCDACMKSPIKGARLICLECSQGEISSSIDVCADCIGKGVRRTRDKKEHTAAHTLLQLRSVLHRRHMIATKEEAEEKLKSDVALVGNDVEGEDKDAELKSFLRGDGTQSAAPKCITCRTTIARPFWCCVNCEDSVFVCYECNAHIERTRPWLYEWLGNSEPELKHDWSHALVIVPVVDASPDVEVDVSVGQRLALIEAKLDARFDEFERVMIARMSGLEALLGRLVETQEENKGTA